MTSPTTPSPPPPVAAPTTLAEAATVLAERPELYVVNGGTDVMVAVNDGSTIVDGWLSLRRIAGLDVIRADLDGAGDDDRGAAVIGGGATFAEIERQLATMVPSLAAAARTVGSPQIRRAGTLGGNLATASPAADSVPPLLCCDAEVELVSTAGTRTIPLEEFMTGPKRTVRRPDELIGAVHLHQLGGVDAFAKVGTRNAMVISVCSLAARLDPAASVARVAIGSAAPTVRRVHDAEAALLDPGAGDDFAAAVERGASPIDDARATAAYRRHALGVLARRTHARLWRSIGGAAA